MALLRTAPLCRRLRAPSPEPHPESRAGAPRGGGDRAPGAGPRLRILGSQCSSSCPGSAPPAAGAPGAGLGHRGQGPAKRQGRVGGQQGHGGHRAPHTVHSAGAQGTEGAGCARRAQLPAQGGRAGQGPGRGWQRELRAARAAEPSPLRWADRGRGWACRQPSRPACHPEDGHGGPGAAHGPGPRLRVCPQLPAPGPSLPPGLGPSLRPQSSRPGNRLAEKAAAWPRRAFTGVKIELAAGRACEAV